MKKLKKFGLLVAVGALVASLALFGCSSNNKSEEANEAEETTTEQEATEGDAPETTDMTGVVLVEDGKLTIAASLDFPPFENLEGDKAVGFSVDLMDMIAKEMGLEANYLSSQKFDTIVPLISAGGKADVGVSSFTITDDRKQEIDFTEAYMDSNQGIVVMKDSGYTSVDDLEGKKIGAQSGTTGYDWAEENIKDAEVIAFDEMTAVFAALQAGQIDAIAADLPVVQYYVKNAYTDMEIMAEIPTGEQYAIVVSKDNPALTKALDAALAKLKADGSYDALYEQWFGASDVADEADGEDVAEKAAEASVDTDVAAEEPHDEAE